MLRYYEEQGLLRPERTGSGYREYAEGDVDRVGRIRCMLSAALPSGGRFAPWGGPAARM